MFWFSLSYSSNISVFIYFRFEKTFLIVQVCVDHNNPATIQQLVVGNIDYNNFLMIYNHVSTPVRPLCLNINI